MTRTAISAKNQHKIKRSNQSGHATKRAELKRQRQEIKANSTLTMHEKIAKNFEITKQMDRLARDSSRCRVRNMCGVCQRARSYISDLGVCRVCAKHHADKIVGLKKGS